MKRIVSGFLVTLLLLCLAACGSPAPAPTPEPAPTAAPTQEPTPAPTPALTPEPVPAAPAEALLPDGSYTVSFDTDSGMFHLNESCMGVALLTVQDGAMTVHLTLASKNIVNLFPGVVADVEANPDMILEPTVDTVTYSDGDTEEVYGFDVPVTVLDEEFDLALLGSKGKWYDHRVSVTNPEPMTMLPEAE